MGELVIHLDDETSERLSEISASVRTTVEEIALAAIKDRVEDLEMAPSALERLREIEQGSVQTVPHAQVMRDLGLEG